MKSCRHDGRAFTSWEDFCQYPEPFGLGMSLQQVAAIVEEPDGSARTVAAVLRAGPGRPKKGEKNGAGGTISRGTNSTDYLDARLKRDRPDLAAEVDAGRMKLREAAREAGIVKPADPYRQLCKWWRVASEDQRAEFEDYIAAWRRQEVA